MDGAVLLRAAATIWYQMSAGQFLKSAISDLPTAGVLLTNLLWH